MADEIVDTGVAPADDTGTDAAPETDSTTTPEEIASVLKSSGITVKPTVDAPAAESGEADAPADEPVNPQPPGAPDPEHEQTTTPDNPAPVETPPTAPADAAAPETPDFSFTVENQEGQTFKVNPGDNLDEVLKDFTPKNAGQLMEIIKQQSAAEAKLEAYNTDQEAAQAEAARTERVAAIQATWDSEITDLQGEKRLPVTADGKPSERLQQVYDFMGKENAKRAETGKPQLASIEDALDKLELQESRDAAAKADKDAKETARANGGLVGGSSAPATGGARTYVAGSARNVNQAIRAAGLL